MVKGNFFPPQIHFSILDSFRYAANEALLVHLKQEHMAVSRVLKPQYSCARCPANFFKNAFLLKHSLTHTQSKQSV